MWRDIVEKEAAVMQERDHLIKEILTLGPHDISLSEVL